VVIQVEGYLVYAFQLIRIIFGHKTVNPSATSVLFDKHNALGRAIII